MIYEVNKLAILITKKIESELIFQFFTSKKKEPTFFNIRESILNVLEEYIDCFQWEDSMPVYDYKEMPKGYLLERKEVIAKKAATELVELIMKNKDYSLLQVFNGDEYLPYRRERGKICVIKSGKLYNYFEETIEVSE